MSATGHLQLPCFGRRHLAGALFLGTVEFGTARFRTVPSERMEDSGRNAIACAHSDQDSIDHGEDRHNQQHDSPLFPGERRDDLSEREPSGFQPVQLGEQLSDPSNQVADTQIRP